MSDEIYFLPYRQSSIKRNIPGNTRRSGLCPEKFFSDYYGREVLVTPNGRSAISLIMQAIKAGPDDEVYITTTFEKPNVSSCVTSTIFNYCRPSRVLTEKTKAIFVIHEFGVPHPRTGALQALCRQKGIPLIEDCAHAIDSIYGGKMIGSEGDYVICSFSKIFPIENGGLAAGKGLKPGNNKAQALAVKDVCERLPEFMERIGEYSEKKRVNFRLLHDMLMDCSITPLFNATEDISPACLFPVVIDNCDEAISALKRSRIECSIWHGSNIIVVPMNQFLEKKDIEKIVNAIRSADR